MDYSSGFCLFLMFLRSTFCFKAVEQSVSAVKGQDCVLPCFGLGDEKVLLLEWIVFDQDRDLLHYSPSSIWPQIEPLIINARERLRDPSLHRGDLSLVLEKVRVEDSGMYRCLAVYRRGLVIPQFIRLTVTEPGELLTEPDSTALSLGLGLGAVGLLLLLLGGFVVGRCLIRKRSKRSQFPSCESGLEKSPVPSVSDSLSDLSEASSTEPLFHDRPSSNDL